MLSIVADRLRELMGADFAVMQLVARYNIAPTQPVVAVRWGKVGREAGLLRWGLVPGWAKDAAIGHRMFNARSETAHEKPAFKYAFRRRRCLVPADGFYEWRNPPDVDSTGRTKQTKPARQPYLITLADEGPFAMGGLWEHWQDEHGNELETCTILTCAANELVGELHDRMPVILAPEDYGRWLDTSDEDVSTARALCKPYPAELMMHRSVGTFVNNPRHEGRRCAEVIGVPKQGESGPSQGLLF